MLHGIKLNPFGLSGHQVEPGTDTDSGRGFRAFGKDSWGLTAWGVTSGTKLSMDAAQVTHA